MLSYLNIEMLDMNTGIIITKLRLSLPSISPKLTNKVFLHMLPFLIIFYSLSGYLAINN